MTGVNKTLYIPLCGKAEVSRKGIILRDPKAEEIWEKEKFPLKGKSRSGWLGYFMSMRAKVFDDWVCGKLRENPEAVVLHIGCGMDSRVLRTGNPAAYWYDIDFPEVIAERKKYYSEDEKYCMLSADASVTDWITTLRDGAHAVVVLEGISMYIPTEKIRSLFAALKEKYGNLNILMDVYTVRGAKMSKYKNPINDVGVTEVYGVGEPDAPTSDGVEFLAEHTMTPDSLVYELQGFERKFFRTFFAGGIAHGMYRLFEYHTK